MLEFKFNERCWRRPSRSRSSRSRLERPAHIFRVARQASRERFSNRPVWLARSLARSIAKPAEEAPRWQPVNQRITLLVALLLLLLLARVEFGRTSGTSAASNGQDVGGDSANRVRLCRPSCFRGALMKPAFIELASQPAGRSERAKRLITLPPSAARGSFCSPSTRREMKFAQRENKVAASSPSHIIPGQRRPGEGEA